MRSFTFNVIWGLTICSIISGGLGMKSSDSEITRNKIPRHVRFILGLTRTKRGFGHGGGYNGGGYGSGGYSGPSLGGGSYGHSYGGGGRASELAEKAANQAKAALAAQGPSAHQAGQRARSILANQASKAAKQAQAVVSAKQGQVHQITQAANAAQAAAYAESTQLAKANRAVAAAEAAKYQAQRAAHYGGYHAREQLYAAKAALEEARNVQAWQAQQAYLAQQYAWRLAQKQQHALHDLAAGQAAANKARWSADAAQSAVYGHGSY